MVDTSIRKLLKVPREVHDTKDAFTDLLWLGSTVALGNEVLADRFGVASADDTNISFADLV